MTIAKEDPQYRMIGEPERLHHYLLGWYDVAKRSMPWRETTDPYAIWLSETMLQQTQVETVKPYYHRFLTALPTPADLASADLQEVLALWAGLGYYRRARHLHAAAQKMVASFDGKVPNTIEGLLSLPGVGRYTAGAVGSIAFGLPAAVVDGNVMRVLARLTGFDGEISEPRSVAFFWRQAEAVVIGAAPRYGDMNQALMELGATVCTPPPSRPACLLCPVRTFCRAYAEGTQLQLPVKKKRGEVAVVRGVALVVRRGTEVLLMQRPRGVVWEEMWEFPVVEGGGEWSVVSGQKGGEGKVRKEEESRRELLLDTSIKNGHGFGKEGVGLERWIEEVLGGGLGEVMDGLVRRVEDCGVMRHGLTHRTMEFRVLRAEVTDGEGNEALRHKGTEGGEGETRNLKPTTENVVGKEGLLPVGATMGGKRYVRWRWVGWPLALRGEVPLARVVFKVGEQAEG